MNDETSRPETANVRITLPRHLLVKLHSVKLLDGMSISGVVEEAVRRHLGSRVREYGERAAASAFAEVRA